jgi:hypothetical protein
MTTTPATFSKWREGDLLMSKTPTQQPKPSAGRLLALAKKIYGDAESATQQTPQQAVSEKGGRLLALTRRSAPDRR